MDGHDGRGPDVTGNLSGCARSEVAGPKVRTPRPDRQEGEVHAAGHVAHLWVSTGVAGEVHASAVVQDVAYGLRARRAGRDPVAGSDRLDRDAGDLDRFVHPDLDDFSRADSTAPIAEPSWHHQDRAAGQAFEGSLVEMVRMPVRDDDDVDLELGRFGEGTVSLEGPEPRPKERVREHANAAEVDQRRRVADESNRDRSRRGRFRVRPSGRRWGHRIAPERAAAASDGEAG